MDPRGSEYLTPGLGGHVDLVYFLHIPKTAGTSVWEWLRAVHGQDAVSPPMLWDHLVSGAFQVTDRTRVVSGHLAGLLPLWLGRWPRIITMLREPLARALSHINHVQREPGHPWHAEARDLSVQQFCAHPVFQRSIDNIQARYLASLSFSLALVSSSPDRTARQPHASVAIAFEETLFSLEKETGLHAAAVHALGVLDAVGIAESHTASLELFARTLGWKADATEIRTNEAASGQKQLESLTALEVDALARLNVIDSAIYDLACPRFHAACRARGIVPNR